MDAQPQFDDVDGFAHVFDSSELEDEWKIRLSRELGVAARERAKHDGITLTELTRKALECDDLNETTDTVRPGRRPKNTTVENSSETNGKSNSPMPSARWHGSARPRKAYP